MFENFNDCNKNFGEPVTLPECVRETPRFWFSGNRETLRCVGLDEVVDGFFGHLEKRENFPPEKEATLT